MIGALEMVQIFQLLFICNHNLLRLNVFESSNVLTVLNPKVIIFFLFKGFFKHILLGFYAFIQEQTVKTTWKMANQLGIKTENRCSLKPAPRPLCRFIFTFFFCFSGLSKAETQALTNYGSGEDENEEEEIEEFEAGPVDIQTSLQASADGQAEQESTATVSHGDVCNSCSLHY